MRTKVLTIGTTHLFQIIGTKILADERTPLQIVQIIGAPENITRACVRVLEVVQKELEKDENKE